MTRFSPHNLARWVRLEVLCTSAFAVSLEAGLHIVTDAAVERVVLGLNKIDRPVQHELSPFFKLPCFLRLSSRDAVLQLAASI